jgi:hypothetical protein
MGWRGHACEQKTILVATGSVDTLSGRLKRLTEEAYGGPEIDNMKALLHLTA